jgi:DNA invertase Pin-like site-specific DNA recombinase
MTAVVIGYARVSTEDQNLDLQRDALTRAGCTRIYEDRISGIKAARPGLALAFEVARSGDQLVVWRLDRLGRSMSDLIALTRTLQERGVELRSLTEGIDTSTTGGKFTFHLFAALAEFERALIRERTQAGLAAARARGRKGGRPKRLDSEKRRQVVALYHDKQHSIAEICRIMGLSKPTYSRSVMTSVPKSCADRHSACRTAG